MNEDAVEQPQKSDVEDAFEKLDQAVRYACATLDANGATAEGVTSVAANWVMIVDERYFKAGKYLGGNVVGLPKPEQPGYISQSIVRDFCVRTGIEFGPFYADEDEEVEEE